MEHQVSVSTYLDKRDCYVSVVSSLVACLCSTVVIAWLHITWASSACMLNITVTKLQSVSSGTSQGKCVSCCGNASTWCMMMMVRLSSCATTNAYAKTMHNKYKRRKTMRVEVYFNLHKHLFSVRSARSGRVILHTDRVHIHNPEFVVRQSGRQRVLKER